MSNQHAVCNCKDRSERDPVLAIRQKRFAWVEEWGCFTWVLVVIMSLVTGLLWVACIFGWHIRDIVNPKYVCQFCGRIINNADLRDYTNIVTSTGTTDNSINDGFQNAPLSETPTSDNATTDQEQELKKIEDMFEKSLITEDEKIQMRRKVLGLG